MDPLSITASVLAILHVAGGSAQVLHKLLSLRDAPQQLQQIWNEAEALRALLLETQSSLHRRRESEGYSKAEASITPVLQMVEAHVLEFEQLIHFRLKRSGLLNGHRLPKVNRSYWLRASSDIQRVKDNIRDSRRILKSRLELLRLDDRQVKYLLPTILLSLISYTASANLKTNILQIQHVTLTSQDAIREIEGRQKELQQGFRQLGSDARLRLEQTQAYIEQREEYTDARLVQMHIEQRRDLAALQAGITHSMQPLLAQMEQTTVASNQSTRLHPHSAASANFDDILGAGAKMSINIPLIIPEENHIVWSLVMAGNMEQLRHLLSHDKNLVYIRNQWGQSLMHVAAKIHQPAVFNFLISIGVDEHLPDENLKTAATTVLTRRGREEYALKIDADDLADRLGWTLLHKAAALTQEGQKLDGNLLESEFIDINSKDSLGRTPLHWLAENGEADTIRLLTQDPWRADVHTRDICGFTALHCACWADSLDSAAALLDAGSDPNARDKHRRTPLLHFDNNELLDLMIEKGADVYISDDEGANIMHHVAIADQAALATTLLEQYGHTICVTNRNGDTPLGLAIQNNSLDVMAILLPFYKTFPQVEKVGMSNHNKRNVLHLAALHASVEVLDMLAAANLSGLDAEARDKDNHTPNECFLNCRNTHCAVARRPFNIEKRSWVRLMRSARGLSEDSLDVANREKETWVNTKATCERPGESFLINDSSSDGSSDEGYVDADDGNQTEDTTE
ncbi:MAG: hypothetical protein Q9213_001178 [Squamulea squamosa]